MMSEEFDAFDDDWPDSDDAESETFACPECGHAVYEDAEQCPACGYYVEDRPASALGDKPAWFFVLGLIGIVATILALAGLLR